MSLKLEDFMKRFAMAAAVAVLALFSQGYAQEPAGRAITVTIGDAALEARLCDTALAKEIAKRFPLTLSMVGYGGREYYGDVDFYPARENLVGGRRTFEDGHITCCESHHNMAIFYAQTERPTLSVDVIPIGKVTGGLSVFASLPSRIKAVISFAE